VANPNLLSSTSITQDILVEAQLASGDNDFTVPSGKAWTVKSWVVCNVSAFAVTLNVFTIKSGATARKTIHNLSVPAGDTAVIEPGMVAVLPEGAVLRLNSSAATALDVTITGVVAA
jgi:hypothetical protein